MARPLPRGVRAPRESSRGGLAIWPLVPLLLLPGAARAQFVAADATAPAVPTGPVSQPSPEVSTFDCREYYPGWQSTWSAQQQDWCCHHEARGCPPQTTACPKARLPHDCTLGLPGSWTKDKLDWCCQSSGVGCVSTDIPFNCRIGVASWQNGWSEVKKSWCCAHLNVGCNHPYVCEKCQEVHDCAFGSPLAWPEAKRAWCCSDQGLGCTTTSTSTSTFGCHQGARRFWSDEKARYCCEEQLVGCPTTSTLTTTGAPDPCTVGSPSSWRDEKKEHCCARTGRGCPTSTSTSSSTTSRTDKLLEVTTTQPITTKSSSSTLTCNLNCYTPSMATAVSLPGSTGGGTDIGVPDTTMEECRQLCLDFGECEAFVHDSTGKSKCWGKKDVHTSAGEEGCQTQPPYVTEMLNRAGPWGKCTLLGDPHVTSFDRKMLGSWPIQKGASSDYMVPLDMLDAGEFVILSSSSIRIHGRFGYTKAYSSAASTLGVAMQGSLIGGKSLAVAYIGPSEQKPAWRGWKILYDGKAILASNPSTFRSPDGLVKASLKDMEPTDFAARGRSTIGTEPGLHASYVFELGGADGGMQVYVLPGPDLCNVVITMRRLADQDGLCGNFNCDWSDDGKDALKARGVLEPVPRTSTFFPDALGSPPGWDKRSGTAPDEILKTCAAATKAACAALSGPEKDSCEFDACMAKAAAAPATLRRFSVGDLAFGTWWWPTRSTLAYVQGLAVVIAVVGCLSVRNVARRAPASTSAGGYALLSTVDRPPPTFAEGPYMGKDDVAAQLL